MALFVGLKIGEDIDSEKLLEILKSQGVKMIEESDVNSVSCIFAMGRKSKYLISLEEFSDEEISDEYSNRGLDSK